MCSQNYIHRISIYIIFFKYAIGHEHKVSFRDEVSRTWGFVTNTNSRHEMIFGVTMFEFVTNILSRSYIPSSQFISFENTSQYQILDFNISQTLAAKEIISYYWYNNRYNNRIYFCCKSLYLIVFVHLKKPCHILDIYRAPRNSLCIILISPWTWWPYLKSLDWIFWNNGHSAFNHALSKVSPKIEWN